MSTFSLMCYSCDAGAGIKCKEEALLNGWQHVEEDDGASWTHLGDFPACIASEEASNKFRNTWDTLLALLDQHDSYEIRPRVTIVRRDQGWVVYVDAKAAERGPGDVPIYHATVREAIEAALWVDVA